MQAIEFRHSIFTIFLKKIMADSTSATAAMDATFCDNMEKLLDKKLKPFESRVNTLQQKQEIFSREVLSLLYKVQKISDELSDEQESAARRFKDEIYKVHDTLDDLSEAMRDAKSYSRDNLDNGDSIKDKVIKIHKHLKVREVLGTDNQDPAESLKEILQRTVVPELQVIKKICNSVSSSPRKKIQKRFYKRSAARRPSKVLDRHPVVITKLTWTKTYPS
jgi:hypothetical protein